MSSKTLNLNEQIYAYLLNNISPESEAAKELREETQAELTMAGMQISPEQASFMAFLVQVLGVHRTIEVGTFTGYSALAVAQALPEDGLLIACDVSEEWTDIGKKYWKQAGVDHKIDLRLAPAVDTLENLLADGAAGEFDFAFIDADKGNYANYYELCLSLLRVGGVIAVDNVLWGGRTADLSLQDASTVAIRNLNTLIASDNRVTSTMLPIGDGLTLVRKS